MAGQEAFARLAFIAATLSATSPWLTYRAIAGAQQCESTQYFHPTGLKEYFVGEEAAGPVAGGIGTMWHSGPPKKPKPGVLPRRRFLLYVPKFYGTAEGAHAMPLYLLFPGAWNEPEKQMDMSEMVKYAEKYKFVFAAMKGDDNLMNVVLHSKSVHSRPDDVEYTKEVLARVRQEVCIDANRIYCTGYSRGARMCSRLASKLSETFAAIAPVSGIRFPDPNAATRPMPILTFHGTTDPINPYEGDGNPEYWNHSVQDAIAKWAKFNGCKRNETQVVSDEVSVQRHTSCKKDADVVLVLIKGGGHVWPGSKFAWEKGLGHVTQDISASVMMDSFFRRHPLVAAPGAAHAEAEARACDLVGSTYQPLGMLGKLPTKEEDIAACQSRCVRTEGCQHFSFYTGLKDCYLTGSGGYQQPGSLGFTAGPAHCLSYLGLATQDLSDGGGSVSAARSLPWVARFVAPALAALVVTSLLAGAIRRSRRSSRESGRQLMLVIDADEVPGSLFPADEVPDEVPLNVHCGSDFSL